MKIFVGSDHAAFEEKQAIINHIESIHNIVDCGPKSAERCDYPDFAKAVAKEVQAENGIGILLCGSGIGISMAANRYSGIRAALCRTEEDAKLSRQHNNSNILCLGGRLTSLDEIKKIIDIWLATDFEEGRHTGRIEKFNNLGEKF